MTDKINLPTEALVAAPPLSVTTAHFLGMSVSDWVIALNLVYIVVALAYKVYKIWKDERGSK